MRHVSCPQKGFAVQLPDPDSNSNPLAQLAVDDHDDATARFFKQNFVPEHAKMARMREVKK
jgi:hypothetical protein